MSIENFLALSPRPVPSPEEIGEAPVLLIDFKQDVEEQKRHNLCWASVISAILRFVHIMNVNQCELVHKVFSACEIVDCNNKKCGDEIEIGVVFIDVLGLSSNG